MWRRLTNEGWCYIVTSSLIRWAHTQNDPWKCTCKVLISTSCYHLFHSTWCALPHLGRVTHICVSKLPTIGQDNGLLPGRRQAIIWTNAGILLNGTLKTNFSEILIKIPTFPFTKMRFKVSSAKWRPCCLSLNVLTQLIISHASYSINHHSSRA